MCGENGMRGYLVEGEKWKRENSGAPKFSPHAHHLR